MMENTLLYGFLIALSMGLGALAIFIWAVLSGQWEDTEDIKYRMLEQELDDERK
jgi:cbb3-type cytochrome oxidase maturation protein